jgi:hypothetical protein
VTIPRPAQDTVHFQSLPQQQQNSHLIYALVHGPQPSPGATTDPHSTSPARTRNPSTTVPPSPSLHDLTSAQPSNHYGPSFCQLNPATQNTQHSLALQYLPDAESMAPSFHKALGEEGLASDGCLAILLYVFGISGPGGQWLQSRCLDWGGDWGQAAVLPSREHDRLDGCLETR